MKIALKNIIKSLKMQSLKSPVKHCPLYKTEGCAYVDSLCDYPNCSMLDIYYLNIYKERVDKNK